MLRNWWASFLSKLTMNNLPMHSDTGQLSQNEKTALIVRLLQRGF